jgi:hypothetical protein
MHLALATVSTQGLWVAVHDSQLIAKISWTDDQSMGLSSKIASTLLELQKLISPELQLEGIAVVSGPGSFTGLRASIAFASGVAAAQKIPLYDLPSYSLFNSTFVMPLQAQRLKDQSFDLALESVEVLVVKGHRDVELSDAATIRRLNATVNASQNIMIKGFAESPLWPEPAELATALMKRVKDPPVSAPIEAFYGYGPKIFGQRI